MPKIDIIATQYNMIDPYLETHERILEIIRSKQSGKELPKRKTNKRDILKEKKSDYVRKFLKNKNKQPVLSEVIEVESLKEVVAEKVEEKKEISKSFFTEIIKKAEKVLKSSGKERVRRPKKITEAISKIDQSNKQEKNNTVEAKISSVPTKVEEKTFEKEVIKEEVVERKIEEKEVLETFSEESSLPELPSNKSANTPVDAKERLRSALQSEMNKDNRMVL